MEIPPLAGSVDAGRLLLAYQIGDRITSIVGRDIDLQTNAGTGQGEAPTYLEIEGITWHGLGEGDQRTEYHLSDNRTEAAKLMRKHSHV
jgi:hypothetical protein